MADKKKVVPSKKPAPAAKVKASDLAARAPQFDDEDQLVDSSGTFRAVSAIQAAQVGHSEGDDRFASDSLVMKAQRDGFREDGPTVSDAADETATDDEAASALKRQRLATLMARNKR
ncbi:MAG: hypothetical protein QM831_31125 [Kofleriaceae bacterium]